MQNNYIDEALYHLPRVSDEFKKDLEQDYCNFKSFTKTLT